MTLPRARVAALLSCHNRRATTLECLTRLLAQEGHPLFTLRTFLVDDGSSDGTGAAVGEQFPSVRVIRGDGRLFWCGGMRVAFATARDEGRFDYFLWLNDDTMLDPDALERLVRVGRSLTSERGAPVITVGSSVDTRDGKVCYGGLQRLWPLPFLRLVTPGRVPRPTTTMHGNLVLIPSTVVDLVGNLDRSLVHLRGDVDYGLRARSLGVEVWVAPGTYASCTFNPIGRWRDVGLPLQARLAAVRHPKYALEEKLLVARRHYGALWFLSPLALYGYILASHVVHRLASALRLQTPERVRSEAERPGTAPARPHLHGDE